MSDDWIDKIGIAGIVVGFVGILAATTVLILMIFLPHSNKNKTILCTIECVKSNPQADCYFIITGEKLK